MSVMCRRRRELRCLLPECAERNTPPPAPPSSLKFKRQRGACASIKRREPTNLNIDMAAPPHPPTQYRVYINNVKMLRMSVQQVGDKLTRGFYAKLCKACPGVCRGTAATLSLKSALELDGRFTFQLPNKWEWEGEGEG